MFTSTTLLVALLTAAAPSTPAAQLFPLDADLRKPPTSAEDDMSDSSERRLLLEMEQELGSKHRSFTEKRLAHVKEAIQPLFQAMPKTAAGKLELPAVSYVLRRVLLDRHAWFVKGLEPESKSWAAWQDADPLGVLRAHVSEKAADIFDTRFAEGLDMNEIAVLMASLEHLVHKESYVRLSVSYESLKLSTEDVITPEEATSVIDTYMSVYLLGTIVSNVSTLSAATVKTMRSKINDAYPSFPETQQFAKEVADSVLKDREFFYVSEVMSVVEEIQDRYGRWQNKECEDLKRKLVDIEDKGIGGAGRVRLADFYDAALSKGRWEFQETADYLRKVGALDDTDPNDLKVIIANYINGPTNCVAATSYYSVCCIDECDGLFANLEKEFGAPDASPAQILDAIRRLPSSSMAAGRTLQPWLGQKLDEVAQLHGGKVPLHGRLFSQWMHYAYPRECIYPHRQGQTKMLKGKEYTKETNNAHLATQEEMTDLVKVQKPGHYKNALSVPLDADLAELECDMWNMEEELLVHRDLAGMAAEEQRQARMRSTTSYAFRCIIFLLLLGSTSKMLQQFAYSRFSKKGQMGDKAFA